MDVIGKSTLFDNDKNLGRKDHHFSYFFRGVGELQFYGNFQVLFSVICSMCIFT